ncbi:MAG: hypothetical protein ACXWXS_00260 [Actinomycetota bacterium]
MLVVVFVVAELVLVLVREVLLADVAEVLELLVPEVLELLVPDVLELDEPLDDVPPRRDSPGSFLAVANASTAVRDTPITIAERTATTFLSLVLAASFISWPASLRSR